jgi:hypothetical protein
LEYVGTGEKVDEMFYKQSLIRSNRDDDGGGGLRSVSRVRFEEMGSVVGGSGCQTDGISNGIKKVMGVRGACKREVCGRRNWQLWERG